MCYLTGKGVQTFKYHIHLDLFILGTFREFRHWLLLEFVVKNAGYAVYEGFMIFIFKGTAKICLSFLEKKKSVC